MMSKLEPSLLTDERAREAASKAIRAVEKIAQVDGDARIVRLDDPPGVAVEAWVYLMDGET